MIGLTNEEYNEQWLWNSDGQNIEEYTNWCDEFPKSPGMFHCARMNCCWPTTKWCNTECDQQNRAICQKLFER